MAQTVYRGVDRVGCAPAASSRRPPTTSPDYPGRKIRPAPTPSASKHPTLNVAARGRETIPADD